jgi:hypothetical protein
VVKVFRHNVCQAIKGWWLLLSMLQVQRWQQELVRLELLEQLELLMLWLL